MRNTTYLRKLVAIFCLTALSAGAAQANSAMDEGEVDGLGAIAMVVLDPDVDAVWNIPTEDSPAFNVADEIPVGSQATLLILFSPPEITERPQRLNCYVTFFAYDVPIGEPYSLRPCYDRVPEGPADYVYLTDLRVIISMKDRNVGVPFSFGIIVEDPDRDISIPLEVSFRAVAGATQP